MGVVFVLGAAFTDVTASSVDGTLTVTAKVAGEQGNAITVSVVSFLTTWSSPTLEGGYNEISVPKMLYQAHNLVVITPSTTGSVFVDVEALIEKLTLPAAPPEGRSFRMEATVTVTSDEALNDEDSSAMFVLVGQVDNGGTVSTIYKNEIDLDTITATRIGQGLQIGFDNNGTFDKRMFVQTTLTAFNHL